MAISLRYCFDSSRSPLAMLHTKALYRSSWRRSIGMSFCFSARSNRLYAYRPRARKTNEHNDIYIYTYYVYCLFFVFAGLSYGESTRGRPSPRLLSFLLLFFLIFPKLFLVVRSFPWLAVYRDGPPGCPSACPRRPFL